MKDYSSILKQLTIEEKCNATHGNSNWTFFGIPRLGYRELFCADGPHGLRAYLKDRANGALNQDNFAETTLFPIAAAMASTFQPHLLYQVGEVIGKECNANDVDIILAPGVNMKRSPLGGRNFEYYSEDPYLSGVCATNFINGVQSTGVGACIKHFAFNEQENQRRFVDTLVDQRTMHEFYLRSFYYAIKHANPMAIMSSYNRINGHYASESTEMLIDVLRKQWGYEGTVISDWGAVQHKVKSIQTGMNVEMPGPSEFQQDMIDALQDGTLTEAQLDEAITPLFALYDKCLSNPNKGKTADLSAHHAIAYNVAKEAIVLLENDGILPLKKGLNVAVIGTFAKNPRINGGGSASTKPYRLEIPIEQLSTVFNTTYADGYAEENTNLDLLNEVEKAIQGQDVILFFTGTTTKLETEGKDREHMNIPQGHLTVFETLKASQKPIVVILNNGSAVNVTPFVGHSNALVESWLLGGANAKALVDILVGDVNPSGRLAETFPLQIEHTPHYGQYPSKLDFVNYSGDEIRNGYRYYDTHEYPVRYPFGYGLSYTTFQLENIRVNQTVVNHDQSITLSVDLSNIGPVAGYEVVQVYVHDKDHYLPRPKKELKAFQKVFVKPGETKTVTFLLDQDAFSTYVPDLHDYVVDGGIFEIFVGTNVNNCPLSVEVDYRSIDVTQTELTIFHPANKFKEYKSEAYKQLDDAVGGIPWYFSEEPLQRVMRRLKRDQQWSNETYQKWLELLLN